MLEKDWNIKPCSKLCETCHRPFTENQPYISCLSFSDVGYSRSDFCSDCWAQCKEQRRNISFWKGAFKSMPPAEEPVKKETVESLLRKLIAKADPTYRDVIFILAVTPEPRRILVNRDAKKPKDALPLRVYEHRKTSETFVITDPMLRLDQLKNVQEQVIAMLSEDSDSAVNSHA